MCFLMRHVTKTTNAEKLLQVSPAISSTAVALIHTGDHIITTLKNVNAFVLEIIGLACAVVYYRSKIVFSKRTEGTFV